MAGIKQIVAPPETFRFPRWKSNINYAPDSVIASNSYGLDSDSTSLYIAKVFIPAGQNRPNLNANWVEMAADAAAINAIVRAQLDQDSDMIVMRAVNRRLDSETDRQRQVDSDFQKEADSEYHWWRAKDSDMSRKFSLMLDSEMHDRKAADSDLNVRVDDADSDIRMVIHDYRSADSDFSDRITELKLFDLFDVKERTLTKTTTIPANYGSFVLNSGPYSYVEFDAFDNSVKQYGVAELNNNGIIRAGTGIDTLTGNSTQSDVIFISKTRITDANFTNEYIVLVPYVLYGTVSMVRVMKVMAVADLSYVTGANTQIFPNKTLPADGVRALKVSGFWHFQLRSGFGNNVFLSGDFFENHSATYNMNATAASSSTVTTAQIVKQGSILRYDSDSEVWVPTDDLTILESNVDSDITWLRGRVLVLESENDSDNYVQNADHDSDIRMVYHDFEADDSDIKVVIQRLKDQLDSDNIVSKPEHDSDVKMLYHDYRAIDSDLTIRINDADSDILMTRHDFRAADSDVIAYLTQPTTLDYGTYF
jgi:hypothetical protein